MLKSIITLSFLLASVVANAETLQFTNVTRSIDSSGISLELVRESPTTFRGTVLICEGGCSKHPLRAVLDNNNLRVTYLNMTTIFKIKGFMLYPYPMHEYDKPLVMCNGVNIKVGNFYCYDHSQQKFSKSIF